jgi:cofilin
MFRPQSVSPGGKGLCFCYSAHHVTHAHSYAFLVPQPLLQATGVIVSEDVVSSFPLFKLKQGEFNLRYFIYVIKDKKEVIIEKRGPPDSTYEDFVAALPPDDCRYGLIDVEFETDDGRPTSKLVFISWNPDTASVRPKMLYAGSKEALKSVLIGVGIQINATDHSELDFEASILPVVKKFTT